MSFERWFTVNFKTPKTSQEEKKFYEGFWEGYVAYHDANVDRVEKVRGHSLKFDWANDTTVNVMLDPLLNPQRDGETVTYTLPAVVTAAAASSDPPLPPPPKR